MSGMVSLYTFDPGESVGWCHMEYMDTEVQRSDLMQITGAGTVPAAEFVGQGTGIQDSLLRMQVEAADIVLYEKFQLYKARALALAGSSLPTVQVIGAIIAAVRWSERQPRLRSEGASSKEVMKRKIGPYGIELVGDSEHARDAELHALFWYYHGRHRGKDRSL